MMHNDRMKELLKELGSNHDLPNFLYLCALWTAETIDEYQFKPLPVEPPEFAVYKGMSPGERADLIPAYFEHTPAILNYLRLLTKIKNENRTIYEWLLDCRTRLADSKPEMVKLLDDKLRGAPNGTN